MIAKKIIQNIAVHTKMALLKWYSNPDLGEIKTKKTGEIAALKKTSRGQSAETDFQIK